MIYILHYVKDLRTLNYDNYCILLIMGNAGTISSAVADARDSPSILLFENRAVAASCEQWKLGIPAHPSNLVQVIPKVGYIAIIINSYFCCEGCRPIKV